MSSRKLRIELPRTSLDMVYKAITLCGYSLHFGDFGLEKISKGFDMYEVDKNIYINIYNQEMLEDKRIREILLEYLL